MAAVVQDAGFEPVECAVIADWRPGRHGIAVVAGVRSPAELDAIAAFVAEYPHIPVVAVVAILDLGEVASALRSGAAAVVAEDDEIEGYRAALENAIEGRTALPVALARSMARRIPASPDAAAWIEPVEASHLRKLAAGKTVAAIADDAGYSEREMFRILNELYAHIGVRNRTEAIVWAARHGVLDE